MFPWQTYQEVLSIWLWFRLFFFFLTIFFCDSSIWTFFVLDIAWGIIKIDFMYGIAHFLLECLVVFPTLQKVS